MEGLQVVNDIEAAGAGTADRVGSVPGEGMSVSGDGIPRQVLNEFTGRVVDFHDVIPGVRITDINGNSSRTRSNHVFGNVKYFRRRG